MTSRDFLRDFGLRLVHGAIWKAGSVTSRRPSIAYAPKDLELSNGGWRMGLITPHLDVSENSGVSPQIIHLFIGLSIINHPFWGTPIFGNTHLLSHKGGWD